MKANYKKKIIGTFIFSFLVLSVLSVSTGVVQAQFINKGEKLTFDGILIEVKNNHLLVDTNGTEPFKVQINNNTKFKPKKTTVDDMVPGDHVFIKANRQGNNYVASSVDVKDQEHSYGTNPNISVMEGLIVSKAADRLVIKPDGNKPNVTFFLTGATEFVKRPFALLKKNDRVRIKGHDDGTKFVADKVWFLLKDDDNEEEQEQEDEQEQDNEQEQENEQERENDNQGNEGNNETNRD